MMRTISTAELRNGVLVLSGYGLRVAIERGHLLVEDGVGADRRQGRFPRAVPGFERLVVLGHAGTVTLEALRWLHDLGISFVQIGADGEVIVAAGRASLYDGRLRRAQALAPWNGVGLRVSQELVRQKLKGQRSVLTRLGLDGDVDATLAAAIDTVDAVDTLANLRLVESQGAFAYWEAWHQVRLSFARREHAKVPTSWLRGTSRRSPHTGTPRTAAHPLNALLNYLYAILEAEARIACLTMGLDPALGLLHADLKSRDSLALDLMEPVRPVVDGWVLDLIRRQVFSRDDFFENRQGVCRVLPPLTTALGETGPRWALELAPIAEWLAQELLTSWTENSLDMTGVRPRLSKAAQEVPSLLTQSRRRAANGSHRTSKDSSAAAARVKPKQRCTVCGQHLTTQGARYCPSCAEAHRLENAERAVAARMRRRALGKDYTPEGRRSLSLRQSANKQAEAAWRKAHPEGANRAIYRCEILPKLKAVPTSQIHRSLGIARPLCAAIRAGRRIPHPRHWEKLRALVTVG
jgi:CRISPR-associated endonuclease Cas1